MLRTLALAAAAIVSSTQAFAWSATVEGPDVFGVTKVIAFEDGARENLAVQCDSQDDLFVAMIMRKKEFEETPTMPATLLIQVDGAAPFTLDATLRDWNDSYSGIVATAGRTPELIAVIKAIQSGRSKINVGADISGNRVSASFSVRGSTAAMTKVIKHCHLEDAPPA